MNNAKKIAIVATAGLSALMLGACGHRGGNTNNPKKDKLSVALITGGFVLIVTGKQIGRAHV